MSLPAIHRYNFAYSTVRGSMCISDLLYQKSRKRVIILKSKKISPCVQTYHMVYHLLSSGAAAVPLIRGCHTLTSCHAPCRGVFPTRLVSFPACQELMFDHHHIQTYTEGRERRIWLLKLRCKAFLITFG